MLLARMWTIEEQTEDSSSSFALVSEQNTRIYIDYAVRSRTYEGLSRLALYSSGEPIGSIRSGRIDEPTEKIDDILLDDN